MWPKAFRVQVIIEEGEAARFKSQARKESKSLSAWLREAGEKMLEMNQRKQPLTDPGALKIFFQECNEENRETSRIEKDLRD